MNEVRFRDEWLVRLVSGRPEVTHERINEFRAQGRRYLSQALVDARLLSFDDIGSMIQEAYRIEYADVSAAPLNSAALQLVPEKICRQNDVLPVDAKHRSVRLAMPNPLDLPAQQQVRWVTGCQVEPVYCLPEHLDRLFGGTMSPDAVIYNLLEKLEETDPVQVLQSSMPQSETKASDIRTPVVRLVNALLAKAVKVGASDIHIEHDEQCSLVRYRVDGHLRNIMKLPRYVGVGPVVSRLKIMADLDIADRLRPQDGRAKILVGGAEIGLRVSTLPTRVGEKVVMRILDERSAQVPLEKLAFAPEIARRMEALLEREQGVLLVTGPTGSGKTTTLYSVLNRLRSETSNVVTVEDPVEYRLEGVNQVQVHEQQGLTFATVLRSVLRQDPDVIMVGEIRDRETAEVVFQAALTGHLVLSTLHTNDAIAAVIRLADMGVEGFKVAAGVIGVTAQRLVRRLCDACAQSVPENELEEPLRRALQAVAREPRVRAPKGCSLCGFSGFKGRIPVVELLQVTPLLRERISAGDGAESLHRFAVETGVLYTLERDALTHLAAGSVPYSEVLPYINLSSSPAPSVPAASAAPVTAGAAPAGARERVLLAVSDAAQREAIRLELEERRFEVEAVSHGADALAALAKGAPALVVLQGDLPILDARKVIATARTVLGLADLSVVVWASEGEMAEVASWLESGADDVVVGRGNGEKVADRLQAVQVRKKGWSSTEDVMRPRIPYNEVDRLADLRAAKLLDTPREERFDAITRRAQELFNVPMALISLVDEDRQWFKSAQGLDVPETSRDASFCAHAIHGQEVFEVPDAVLDPRFAENPLVLGNPNIRFYAGYPLTGPAGHKLGTLCILDRKPRELRPEEAEALRDLARVVEDELRTLPLRSGPAS